MVKYFQNKDKGYLSPARRAVLRLWDARFLNSALIVTICLLFAGYLAMNNQVAANGFTIKAIEKRIADLEEQRRNLDLDVYGRQSMDNVEAQVQSLGFIPVQGVDYLTAVGGVVAFK
jgi:hypothetical protein